MKTVLTLAEVEPWCLAAKPGDVETFSVGEDVSEDEVSVFRAEVNQKTDKHCWIQIRTRKKTFSPELTTVLEVRCTY